MGSLIAPILPSVGLDFIQKDIWVYAATSSNISRGQILEIDLTGASSGSTGDTVGAQSDRLARAIEPQDATGAGGRIMIVALEAARIGRKFKARLRGMVEVILYDTYRAGDVIIQNVGQTDGCRVWGIVLESGGTTSTATRAIALWDGEMGFGTLVGATPPGGAPTYPSPGDLPVAPPAGGGGGPPSSGGADDIGSAGSTGVGIPTRVIS